MLPKRKLPLMLASFAVGVAPWIIAGCARGSQENGAEHEPAHVAIERGDADSTVVQIDAASLEHLGVRTAAVETATMVPTADGYARAVDPTGLVELASAERSARAAFDVAAHELDRLNRLVKGESVTERALEAAQGSRKQTEADWNSARARLVLAWGSDLPQREDFEKLVADFIARRRILVRVDLVAGEDRHPARVTLSTLHDPSSAIPTEIVGSAPTANDQLQGRGFLTIAEATSPSLVPGVVLAAHVELEGASTEGFRVPNAAVVRSTGKEWVYVRIAPARFERRRVEVTRTEQGFCIATGSITSGNEIVVAGAQALLSSESAGSDSGD